MEKVAATILREYSKPNIWVEDVDVQEWVKKPLKCIQTKNGVKIGSKAFNLGLNEIMKLSVSDQPSPPPSSPPPPPTVAQPPQQHQPAIQPSVYNEQHSQGYVQQQSNFDPSLGRKIYPHEMIRGQQHQGNANQNLGMQRSYASSTQEAYPEPQQQPKPRLTGKISQAGLQYVQRVEICDPPSELVNDVSRLRITPGKKYQILEERLGQNGRDYLYKIVNDDGREVMIGWHYFRQPQAVLQEVPFYDQNGNLNTSSQWVDQANEARQYQHQPKLLYQNEYDTPNYGGQHGQNSYLDNMMQKMDQAIRRRTGR